MRNDLTLMTAVAALLTVYSLGAVAKDGPGQQFITRAVQGNLAEVAMGQAYEKEAKRSDGSVSEYAKATLPTLEKHLQTAQSLARAGTPTQ
jgi:predicted outer membrane protein